MKTLKLQRGNFQNKHVSPSYCQIQQNGQAGELGNKKYKILSHFLVGNDLCQVVINQIKRGFSRSPRETVSNYKRNEVVINFGQQQVNYQIFGKLLAFCEGKQIEVNRSEQVVKMVKIAQILQIQEILDCIKMDLEINQDQYGFFTLYFLVEGLELECLQEKCKKQLIKYGFEQMNYSLYDLLQCSLTNFIKILRIHKDLVSQKMCHGQSNNTLKQIISQYCMANKVTIDANEFLPQYLTEIKEQDETEEGEFDVWQTYMEQSTVLRESSASLKC